MEGVASLKKCSNSTYRFPKTTEYTGARVLVTGASGFIGARVLHMLDKLGAEACGTYHNTKPEELSDNWRSCDLTDYAAVAALLRDIKPDVIFHLASHVSGRRSMDAVMPTFHNNLMSTVNLLCVAQEMACKRIVLANSMEEPELSGSYPVPSSPYAAAKFAGAAYARMFHALHKTPVVIARIFMVYGPGQGDVTKLVPHVTLNLLKGEAPKLTSGSRLVDWVYVDDVVKGLLALGIAPGILGDTIDLGSGEKQTVRAVAEMFGQIIENAPPPEFGLLADRAMEQERVADVEMTFKKTGWKPSTALRTGLTRTVKWYRTDYESRYCEPQSRKISAISNAGRVMAMRAARVSRMSILTLLLGDWLNIAGYTWI
jgi:nucleoside-diphosphate-sugar epimerase